MMCRVRRCRRVGVDTAGNIATSRRPGAGASAWRLAGADAIATSTQATGRASGWLVAYFGATNVLGAISCPAEQSALRDPGPFQA
jgi:hypothetical protein